MGEDSNRSKIARYAVLATVNSAALISLSAGDVHASLSDDALEPVSNDKPVTQTVDQSQMKPALQEILGPNKKAVLESAPHVQNATAPVAALQEAQPPQDGAVKKYVKAIPGNVFGGLSKITGAVTGFTDPLDARSDKEIEEDAKFAESIVNSSPAAKTTFQVIEAAGTVGDVMIVAEPTLLVSATIGSTASNLYNEVKDDVKEKGGVGFFSGVGSFFANAAKGVVAAPLKVVDGVTMVVGFPTNLTGAYAKVVSPKKKDKDADLVNAAELPLSTLVETEAPASAADKKIEQKPRKAFPRYGPDRS